MTAQPPINLSEYCNQLTLSRLLFTEEMKAVTTTSNIIEIINSFQTIGKAISVMLQRVGLPHSPSVSKKKGTSANIFATASDMALNLLSNLDTVGVIVSSCHKGPIEVKSIYGKFIVVYNPLEALSNVDLCLNTGTTFGILVKNDMESPKAKDATNPNTTMVAAGYILYGSATIFVLATNQGVNEFVLDTFQGEFVLTQSNLNIPDKGSFYSINEGYMGLWDVPIKEYIREKKFPEKKKTYTASYVGSMVSDVHRILKHGGIFMYPSNKDEPDGRLKLLCECKPMAFIVTQAGGIASNGTMPILDIEVAYVSQRTPFFLGTVAEVRELKGLIENHRT